MSDVFEDRRDLDTQRERLWTLIAATQALDWQILTKRPENMLRLAPTEWRERWPANTWAGTTVEDQERADERIQHLLRIPAAIRFLSCEPLLGPVHLFDKGDPHPVQTPEEELPPGISWVIVGGESGPGARPMQIEWARSLVEQCRVAGCACFVKQLGAQATADYYDRDARQGLNAIEWPNPIGWHDEDGQPTGRVLLPLADRKGGDMAEWPADLRVRKFPQSAVAEEKAT